MLVITGARGAIWLPDKIAKGWKLPPAAILVIASGRATGPGEHCARRRAAVRHSSGGVALDGGAHSAKTVLFEYFGFDLVRQPHPFLFPVGAAGCLDAMSLLKGKIACSTVEQLRQARSNIDIGTVAHDKLSTCQADYFITTQFDRYNAERQRFPAEYARYRMLLWGYSAGCGILASTRRHGGSGHADIQAPRIVVPHAIFNRPPRCYDRVGSDRQPAGNTKLAPEFSSSSSRADRRVRPIGTQTVRPWMLR